MTVKKLFGIIGAVVAAVAVVAGVFMAVAYFTNNKSFGRKNYIECECEPDYT